LIQLVVDLTNDYYYIKVDLPFFNLFNLFNVFNKVEKISETIEVIELNYLIEKVRADLLMNSIIFLDTTNYKHKGKLR